MYTKEQLDDLKKMLLEISESELGEEIKESAKEALKFLQEKTEN
jgi:hypothetical protein